MPRVVVMNNYPLDAVWEEVRRGDTPDHVLFGVNYFAERGYECDFLPCTDGGPKKGINHWLKTARFPFPLGDVEQQYEVFKRIDQADIIYAACEAQSAGIACLRALGLFNKPIVCVVHHPLNRGRLSWMRSPYFHLVTKGTDALVCLSQCVAEEIGTHAFSLPWGPDTEFYPRMQGPGERVVAFGRTGRDFITFGKAATRARTPVKIICTENYLSPEFDSFGPNVQVIARATTKAGWMMYPELNQHLGSARAIAIPLAQQDSLAGLTSLMDALGLGRPVIMTRNPHVNLDIEAEGIGRWVEPGDLEGWSNALRWFEDHPTEASEMGQRGRHLVDAGLNSSSFAHRILDTFDRLLEKP